MTDAELIARLDHWIKQEVLVLVDSDILPIRDRIEALTEQLAAARQDAKEAEAYAEEFEKDLNTCRMAQAVMDNTAAGLKDGLTLMMTERDEAWKRAAHAEKMWGEAEVKLAKAVEALQFYAYGHITPPSWQYAHKTLAEIKGETK